jgi:hypothetical protein
MALIIKGESECALCGEVILASDDAVGTAHFITDPSDKFYRYSDAPFHKRCFDSWKHKATFTARYEQFVRRSGSAS